MHQHNRDIASEQLSNTAIGTTHTVFDRVFEKHQIHADDTRRHVVILELVFHVFLY